VLIVSGRKNEVSEKEDSDFIYRGIATRSFERRFALADHIQVKGADMKDGLLSIELVREIPEAMKPKKIEIGGSQGKPQHDQIGSDQPASKQTVNAKAEREHA
jgi:molecular chaperone IbpA